MVDRDGRHARAERRAQVPFVDRVVVAVPVQVHPLARLLIPERREIRRADDFIRRQPIEAPVELDRLVRIERVDAAAPPLRHPVFEDRRDAVPERERLELHPIDEPAEANERPLEERRRIAHLLHVPEDRLGCRPVVERAVEHELHERLQLELCRRHSEDDAGRSGRRVADRARVADGAIEADVIDADAAPARDADRQIVARLEHEPERRVPARQLLRTNRRQRAEDRIRRQNAADRLQQRHAGLAANRSVLEVIGDLVVGHRAVDRKRHHHPERHDGEHRHEHAQTSANDRFHWNVGGEKTDITSAIISSRLL